MNRAIPVIAAVALFWAFAVTRLDAATRVALLQTDPQKTGDAVALVEAQLTADGKVELVERQQVEQVLHEQQLQAVLGADAVAGRAAMGKLLQADLLVFVRWQEPPKPAAESARSRGAPRDSKDQQPAKPIASVVISETHHGLRLVRQPIDIQDPEKAAATITRLIEARAAKQGEKIGEIFAVPPFVSDDLGFEFNHLKGAYAKIVEEALSEAPGVLMVELEEARALAREIALSNADDVRRSLPLYVLGQFRNDGADDSRRVRIVLKLMRGERQVQEVTKADLPPEQAATVLREASASFLAKSNVAAQPQADPKIEAAQLAKRARIMKDLGSWREALDLAEAGILLDPHEPQLRIDVLEVLTRISGDTTDFEASVATAYHVQGSARIGYYRHGLEHLETYLRAVKIDRRREPDNQVVLRFATALDRWGFFMLDDDVMRGALGPQNSFRTEMLLDPAVRKKLNPLWRAFAAARQESAEMFYRVLDAKAKAKVVDDTLWYTDLFDGWNTETHTPQGPLWLAVNDPAKVRDKHLALLSDFAYLPKGGEYVRKLIEFPGRLNGDPYNYFVWLQPGYAEFLKQAREVPNESVRKEVDRLWAEIDVARRQRQINEARQARERAEAKPYKKPPAPKPDPNDEVKLTKVVLRIQGAAAGAPPVRLNGCFPAGKGTDFVWDNDGIYVMTEPGVLRPTGLPNDDFAVSPCFDGRYVWIVNAASGPQRSCRLFLFDPGQMRKVAEVTDKQGLPPCQLVSIVPLGPGRVFMVGYFGQTFAAEIDFEPGSDAKVKVVHEFRKVPLNGDKNEQRDPELIFQPRELAVLGETKTGGQPKEVVAWCEPRAPDIFRRPLRIDVATGKAQMLDQAPFTPSGILAHDGVCDVLEWGSGPGLPLYRISLSGVATRPTDCVFSYGKLLEYGGALHCVDASGWLVTAKDKGPFRRLKVTYPRADHNPIAVPSENFGLLMWFNQQANQWYDADYNVYRVDFAKPLPQLLPKP